MPALAETLLAVAQTSSHQRQTVSECTELEHAIDDMSAGCRQALRPQQECTRSGDYACIHEPAEPSRRPQASFETSESAQTRHEAATGLVHGGVAALPLIQPSRMATSGNSSRRKAAAHHRRRLPPRELCNRVNSALGAQVVCSWFHRPRRDTSSRVLVGECSGTDAAFVKYRWHEPCANGPGCGPLMDQLRASQHDRENASGYRTGCGLQ
jgi:uncharacterized protein with von Willebrand factor type A (vWA) domain